MRDIEFELLLAQYKRKRAEQATTAMYAKAKEMKDRELTTALSKLNAHGSFSDEQRAVVESLADAVVNQLLAAPTETLQDAAENEEWDTIDNALQLFDLEDSPETDLSTVLDEMAMDGIFEGIDSTSTPSDWLVSSGTTT